MKRAGLVCGLMFAAVLGCSSTDFRLQSADEEKASDKLLDVKTVGSTTSMWSSGMRPVRVHGVGVVNGLHGTGSDPEPGEMRQMALRLLKEQGCPDPVAYLARPDTAVVMVSATIPPGARKGDMVDVDVQLDSRDKATSLRGGSLLFSELREYADAHQLRGGEGDHAALKGHVLVRAKGPLLVGLAEAGDKNRLRQGRIWGGGQCLIERNFALMMTNKDARTAKLVADRLNERFYGPFRGTVRGMAEAKTDTLITLKIPPQYQHNWPRYLRVARQVPLRDTPTIRAQYHHQLSEQLLDPAKTVVAALKLEALGVEAVPDLQRGLKNESPLVRFCSAEALAYLGEPCCAEPLAEVTLQHPELRAYGLTALASLNEGVCHLQLRELMKSPSAETKYGAFRALRALDEKDLALNETQINESFYLHKVAADSSPLIHISTVKRAEVVLFGEDHLLLPPFALQAGTDFVLTANEGEDQCIIARISAKTGTRREISSLKVNEVILKLGAMGAIYPDVVELLQQAQRNKNLSCRVAMDAVPQSTSVYALAYQGRREKEQGSDLEDEDAETDMGMTPNLFALPGRRGARPQVSSSE